MPFTYPYSQRAVVALDEYVSDVVALVAVASGGDDGRQYRWPSTLHIETSGNRGGGRKEVGTRDGVPLHL